MLIRLLTRQLLPVVILSGSVSTMSDAGVIETADTHLASCGAQYVNGTLPNRLQANNLDLYYLCFDGFAVGYSAMSKTAIWSAEHLTRERIEQADSLEREDNFHEDSRLPNSAKSYLKDYQHTPYDRGHLAPNGDMATLSQQYDSFSLANIVPQHPKNNRGIWKNLESRTRFLTLKYGEMYVVTGTVYLGKTAKRLNHNVLVPTHLYKAIYVPSLNQAGVYYVANDDSQQVEVISLDTLAKRTQLQVMPSLPDTVQTHALALPLDNDAVLQDTPTTQDDNPNEVSNSSLSRLIGNLILAMTQWLIQLFKH